MLLLHARFEGDKLRQELFGEVSGEIQHQLDHPGLGVNDTGLAGGSEGEHGGWEKRFNAKAQSRVSGSELCLMAKPWLLGRNAMESKDAERR